jgi:DNA polymerase-1
MLRTYVEKFTPSSVYVVWDKKICWPSTNFRKKQLNNTYKGTRNREHSDQVYSNEPIIEELCDSLGCNNMYPYKLEADDVISWLTTVVSPNIIVTTDKDMLQLVSNDTSYFHTSKKLLITPENFYDEIDVPLESYVYYKAILGDSSDNIPGFPGHGKVRSKKLAIEITKNNGDLDKINITEDYKQLFHKNIKLCDLNNSWENESEKELESYKNQFSELSKKHGDFEKFERICKEEKYVDILKKIEDWKALFTFPEKQANIVDILSK